MTVIELPLGGPVHMQTKRRGIPTRWNKPLNLAKETQREMVFIQLFQGMDHPIAWEECFYRGPDFNSLDDKRGSLEFHSSHMMHAEN